MTASAPVGHTGTWTGTNWQGLLDWVDYTVYGFSEPVRHLRLNYRLANWRSFPWSQYVVVRNDLYSEMNISHYKKPGSHWTPLPNIANGNDAQVIAARNLAERRVLRDIAGCVGLKFRWKT